MSKKHILVICSMNKWRSRTAEEIFKNHQELTVKSAGTSSNARITVNRQLLNWAEAIYVMELKHKAILLRKYADELEGKEMIVLDIEDNYQFMDEELIDELLDCIH